MPKTVSAEDGVRPAFRPYSRDGKVRDFTATSGGSSLESECVSGADNAEMPA